MKIHTMRTVDQSLLFLFGYCLVRSVCIACLLWFSLFSMSALRSDNWNSPSFHPRRGRSRSVEMNAPLMVFQLILHTARPAPQYGSRSSPGNLKEGCGGKVDHIFPHRRPRRRSSLCPYIMLTRQIGLTTKAVVALTNLDLRFTDTLSDDNVNVM
jgi:hypothetical protein